MVSEMKPEVVSSSQNFSLCAPLRNSACTEQHKRFFQLCRQEALNDLASGGLSGRATIIPFYGGGWGVLLPSIQEKSCMKGLEGPQMASTHTWVVVTTGDLQHKLRTVSGEKRRGGLSK